MMNLSGYKSTSFDANRHFCKSIFSRLFLSLTFIVLNFSEIAEATVFDANCNPRNFKNIELNHHGQDFVISSLLLAYPKLQFIEATGSLKNELGKQIEVGQISNNKKNTLLENPTVKDHDLLPRYYPFFS